MHLNLTLGSWQPWLQLGRPRKPQAAGSWGQGGGGQVVGALPRLGSLRFAAAFPSPLRESPSGGDVVGLLEVGGRGRLEASLCCGEE